MINERLVKKLEEAAGKLTKEEGKAIANAVVDRMNKIRKERVDLNASPLEVAKLLVTGSADPDAQFVAGVLLLTSMDLMDSLAMQQPDLLKTLMNKGIGWAATLQLEYQLEEKN